LNNALEPTGQKLALFPRRSPRAFGFCIGVRTEGGNYKEAIMLRTAYEHAAALLVDTVAQIPESQWHQPGVGVWTIRDLVGHTAGGLQAVETALATPATRIDIPGPVDYYLQGQTLQAILFDPAAVEARRRRAEETLGTDPVRAVHDIAVRVVPQVQAAADDALVRTIVGGIRFIDYLPSRVCELTIHTLDLAAALACEVIVPEPAATVTLQLLMALAVRSGQAAPLLLAATGRRALPDGFNVLGL
jgi:hypothetical protein